MTVNKITAPPTPQGQIDKINEIIDNLGSGGTVPVWGNITGTLSNQTDLQDALDEKQDVLTAGTDLEIIGSSSSIPSGYTQVEYLESSGTQYIDLGKISSNDVIDIKCEWPQVSNNYLLGSLEDGANWIVGKMLGITYYNTDRAFYNRGTTTSSAGGAATFFNITANTEYTIHWQPSSNQITVNGTQYTGAANNNCQTTDVFETANNLYLFCANRGGVAGSFDYVKIRKFSIVGKRNLIPCRRNSDSVLGMYDTVSGNFLTNQGTGTFTAGADVPENLTINFTNNSGYITSSALSGYATETYVDTGLATKQATLISGTNIKTINGNSLLGSGDITIQSGVSYSATCPAITPTSGVASWNVTHNLGTENIIVSLYNSSGALQECNVTVTSANAITVNFKASSNVSAGDYKIVVLASGSEQTITPSRNIGEIITSAIPLTDSGVHLLDGSLISGSGAYSAFVTYIASLVSTYPDLFETEANYQTAISTYGVCGKFVYDSVNNTVRLPKVTGIIEGTTDLTAIGDLVQAGLPNITGTIVGLGDRDLYGVVGHTGALGVLGNASSRITLMGEVASGVSAYPGFDIDASRSSSIYGNSTKVQPQTIKLLFYIVIANSIKTEIQIDIDEVATDINTLANVVSGKANISLSNVTASDMTTAMENSNTPVVTESYYNNGSWYRVYSDGWCEQGGELLNGSYNTPVSVTFLKPFSDAHYTITGMASSEYTSYPDAFVGWYWGTKTATSVSLWARVVANAYPVSYTWQACGYIN